MSTRHQKKKTPKVAIKEDCVQEFYPMTNPSYPPVSTASNVSENSKPLDEIALLKKGHLKKNYERHMRPQEQQPVTMDELIRRGFLKSDGRIVHSIPSSLDTSSIMPSTVSQASSNSLSSSGSSKAPTSILSKISLLGERVISEQIYDVGLPNENAKLKIGKTVHGDRYELIINQKFQAVLDLSEKAKTLITFNA